jgi:hypothetical protein
MTAWFACRVITDARANGVRALAGGHCAPHLVHSAAMLYMFLALVAPASAGQGMSGMGGSSGMPSLDVPTLGLVFALILAGYTVWDLDQISGRSRAGLAGVGPGRQAVALAGVPGAVSGTGTVAFSGDSGTGTIPESGPAGVQRSAAGPGDAVTVRYSDALLTPAVTVTCRIAMGAAMAFMLLVMI